MKSIFELAENLSLVLTKLDTELGLAQPQLVCFSIRNRFLSADEMIIFRWTAGPKVNGIEPILVVFEDKDAKDQIWMKLSLKMRDSLVDRRDSITVTQVRFGPTDLVRAIFFSS